MPRRENRLVQLALVGDMADRREQAGDDVEATAEVDRLLASYEMPEADPALDAEARAIIKSGQTRDEELPEA